MLSYALLYALDRRMSLSSFCLLFLVKACFLLGSISFWVEGLVYCGGSSGEYCLLVICCWLFSCLFICMWTIPNGLELVVVGLWTWLNSYCEVKRDFRDIRPLGIGWGLLCCSSCFCEDALTGIWLAVFNYRFRVMKFRAIWGAPVLKEATLLFKFDMLWLPLNTEDCCCCCGDL